MENRPKRKEKLFGLDSNPLTDKPISNTCDRLAEGADGPRTGAVQLLENVKIAISHIKVCQDAVKHHHHQAYHRLPYSIFDKKSEKTSK